MTLRACGREKDVEALLRAGHWPAACDEELRAHVAECRRCGDLVLVSEALLGAKAAANGARMDAAGVIWWRAQLRRKSVAMQAMSRPMLGAQLFALGMGVVVVAGLLVVEMRGGGWTRFWVGLDQTAMGSLRTLWPMGGGGSLLLVVCAVGMMALAGGLALYVALDRQ